VVCDLDSTRVEGLVDSGAKPAASGEDLAAAVDVLFTSLPGAPPQRGGDAAPARRVGGGSTWVDMTTNDRRLVIDLAERAKARRIELRDAPVTGPSTAPAPVI
jgi:3-hydroxyisobutyrate dehydrogenase-like beta-hydroxyacid dehydrogenase